MPHLILEYTDNITDDINFENLFGKFHGILSNTGGILINNCKSRACKLEDYYVGDGLTGQKFVHLDISFLEGRSTELKQEIGKQMLEVLEDFYSGSVSSGEIQISVEVRDIKRDFYCKFPSGTLSDAGIPG